jgi:hypothetical protein
MSKYTEALKKVNDTWSRLKYALDKSGISHADIQALIKEHDDALKDLNATPCDDSNIGAEQNSTPPGCKPLPPRPK